MTVGELLEQLKDQPKDRLVMSASDAEGNNIRKVDEVAVTSDIPLSLYSH